MPGRIRASAFHLARDLGMGMVVDFLREIKWDSAEIHSESVGILIKLDRVVKEMEILWYVMYGDAGHY
jgi:hypothetical protein